MHQTERIRTTRCPSSECLPVPIHTVRRQAHRIGIRPLQATIQRFGIDAVSPPPAQPLREKGPDARQDDTPCSHRHLLPPHRPTLHPSCQTTSIIPVNAWDAGVRCATTAIPETKPAIGPYALSASNAVFAMFAVPGANGLLERLGSTPIEQRRLTNAAHYRISPTLSEEEPGDPNSVCRLDACKTDPIPVAMIRYSGPCNPSPESNTRPSSMRRPWQSQPDGGNRNAT